MNIQINALASKRLRAYLFSLLGMTALLLISSSVYAETCYTACAGAIQLECGTNRPFGACVGAWGCEDGRGAHLCLKESGGDVGNTSTCKNDDECPPGYGCATWAVKKNECVKKCDKDGDCPSGQNCKKPIGTSFKRCK